MDYITTCLLTGFLLDLLLGDPLWLYHPVRMMGYLIGNGEKVFRKIFSPKPHALFTAGMLLWIFVAGVSFLIPYFILKYVYSFNLYAGLAVESFFCYQILAVKSLNIESMTVYRFLSDGNLCAARKNLSMIVGRDTANLDEEGIAKAAVETVSENTADGVIAPMLFFAVGGAPLAFLYKSVNTMDSMIGYNNSCYSYFGKFAAKMDDIFNFIPAEISAIFMIFAAKFIPGLNASEAFRIYKRDKRNHLSPNSAKTEAVCAGALGIQLGGTNYYGGKPVVKMTIGDNLRKAVADDIRKANTLMFVTALTGLLFCVILRITIVIF